MKNQISLVYINEENYFSLLLSWKEVYELLMFWGLFLSFFFGGGGGGEKGYVTPTNTVNVIELKSSINEYNF